MRQNRREKRQQERREEKRWQAPVPCKEPVKLPPELDGVIVQLGYGRCKSTVLDGLVYLLD